MVSLYKQFKAMERKQDVRLYAEDDAQFQFYNQAKELVTTVEDKFSSTQIKYFKTCRSLHILEIPLLFKFMENNLVCFKGFKLTL